MSSANSVVNRLLDPTLTVTAPGQFTLTATVQGVSTRTTWNAASGPLSSGTILWSAPVTAGSNVTQIIQAEPVTGGPDLFSVEMNPSTGDSTIRALTSDGEQQWSQLFQGTYSSATADGNGGLIINYHNQNASNGSYALVDLDAQTGAKIWENDSVFLAGFQPRTTLFSFSQAIAPDGTILLAGDFNYAFDPNTGAATIEPPPPNAPQGSLTWWDFCGGPVHTVPYPFTTQQTGPYGSVVIGPTIAADGTMFQVVSTLTLAFTPSPCSSFLSSVNLTLYLSQTAPDGSVTFTPFHAETSLIPDSYPFPRSVTVPQCYPRCTVVGEIPPNEQLPTDITFRVIPDGQGGALIPWWKDLGYYTTFEAHVTHISTSGVSDVVLPLNYQNTAIQNSNVCPFNPGQLPCIADFRLVLGENGIAFATDLQSVIAFNVASMAPLWTYSSASSLDLVVATADGGVTINDAQLGLVPLDANGRPGTPSASHLSTVTPWALGNWMGNPNGTFAEFAGPATNIAVSGWPEPEGDAENQHSPEKPRIAHFIPVDQTALGINPKQALTEIENGLPPKVARHDEFVGPAATVQNFVDDLAKPIAAIGFIGHSFDDVNTQNQVYSVGLGFYDKSLVAPPNNDPQFPVRQYFNTVTTARILTQARVVFIGSCFIGPPFLSLWNIQNGTTGQALIVPQGSSPVILGHAVTAWAHLLDDLVLLHMKAQDAVNDTNKYLLTLPGVTEQWQVVGDGNVKIN